MQSIQFGNSFYDRTVYTERQEVAGEQVGTNFLGRPKYQKEVVDVPVTVNQILARANRPPAYLIDDESRREMQERLGYQATINAAGFAQLHEDLVMIGDQLKKLAEK